MQFHLHSSTIRQQDGGETNLLNALLLQYRVCNVTGVPPVQSLPCGQICLPLAPKMVSARFDSDGRTVMVTLNQAAKSLMAPCSRLFDAATAQKMGLAQCTGGLVSSSPCVRRQRSLL